MNNFVTVHIKVCRSNYFLIISDRVGKVLFTKSCGNLGLKNIQKRSPEGLNLVVQEIFKFILSCGSKNYFLIKLEGSKNPILRKIYKQFLIFSKKCVILIIGICIVNKISHNGCRKKSVI